MRRHRGRTSDSARWAGFRFRDDDVVISTPSKCLSPWLRPHHFHVRLDDPAGGATPWILNGRAAL